MADVIIEGVPDWVVAAIDASAARLGLSRDEYLQVKLVQDAASSPGAVTWDDLRAFSATFADLGDDDTMASAWR